MNYFFLSVLVLGRLFELSAQPDAPLASRSLISDNFPSVTEQRALPTATMIKVKPKHISEGLKSTLQNIGYLGWEKGQLYFDPGTKEYALLFSINPSVKDRSEDNTNSRENSENPPQTWYFFTYEGRQFTY